jgi:DeoR/GlpR family transcriptional regulator of sugar metabolism
VWWYAATIGVGETVQAVETAFDILGEIRSRDNVTLSELADELSLAKSTVHRYLRTLNDRLLHHARGWQIRTESSSGAE